MHSNGTATWGPHATLTDLTVRESIMTSTHSLGCKCCGTYDRHNEIVQVAFAWFKHGFKYELKYSGSTGSFDSNYVGISAKGSSKHTDGQVCPGECPVSGKSGL